MLYDSFKIFPRQAFFYIKFLPPKHLPFAQQFLDVKRCFFFQADIIYTASSGIFVYSCFVGFAQSEMTYFYWIIIFIAITLSICKRPLIKSWNNDCCQINCNEPCKLFPDWEQCRWSVPVVPWYCTVRTFHRSTPV